MKDGVSIKGHWKMHFVIRDIITGFRQEYVDHIDNLVTNEGMTAMLGYAFHGDTQVNPWYIGLKGTGTASYTDTASNHAGWSEITVYSGNRVEFVEAAAASQSITNTSSVANFLITSAAQVYGAALFSVASKAGVAGVLFSAGNISSFRTVDSGDQINITYTITGSGS